MICQEGGSSIVMREIGTLYVPRAGMKMKQKLFVKLWDTLRIFMVSITLVNKGYYKFNGFSVVSNFGRGNSPILSKTIKCSSNDETLSHCDTIDMDVTECQHVAGVICQG